MVWRPPPALGQKRIGPRIRKCRIGVSGLIERQPGPKRTALEQHLDERPVRDAPSLIVDCNEILKGTVRGGRSPENLLGGHRPFEERASPLGESANLAALVGFSSDSAHLVTFEQRDGLVVTRN